tara:strand:+ start:3221 stop:3352 length:132 start_codon:yes stop_codon:yes gene_type:complete
MTTIQPIKRYTAGGYACWRKRDHNEMPLDAWLDGFSLAVTEVE